MNLHRCAVGLLPTDLPTHKTQQRRTIFWGTPARAKNAHYNTTGIQHINGGFSAIYRVYYLLGNAVATGIVGVNNLYIIPAYIFAYVAIFASAGIFTTCKPIS